MKKLCYITCSRIPTEKAHGVNIVYMCEALSQYYDTTLLVPVRYQTETMKGKNVEDVYDVKPAFNIQKIKIPDLIRFNYIPYINVLHSLMFSLLCLINVKVTKEKPDFIFTRQPIEAFIMSFSGIPFVYEMHDRSFHRLRIMKRIFKKAQCLFPISEGLKREIPQEYWSKTSVLPDAVPRSFLIQKSRKSLRDKLKLPNDKKIVLYTGKLSEEKGVDFLITVAQRLPQYLFLLVGGLEQDLKKYKQRVGASQKNVLLRGYVVHKDIKDYLNSADILVIPNIKTDIYSSTYTSPIKLYEYISSGKPILASNVESLKVFKDLTFFDPGNNEDFIMKIKNAKNRKPLIYTWDDRAKKVWEDLNDIHK